MARGESRKRKPGTPDYRKRFWAAVTAIVVAAGSIGVSHAGFTLPNQAQKQMQMAAAETEPAEQTAKKRRRAASRVSMRQCMRLRTCSTCVRAVERSMRL